MVWFIGTGNQETHLSHTYHGFIVLTQNQCRETDTIYFGSGSAFGKVTIPAPVPNPDPDIEHI